MKRIAIGIYALFFVLAYVYLTTDDSSGVAMPRLRPPVQEQQRLRRRQFRGSQGADSGRRFVSSSQGSGSGRRRQFRPALRSDHQARTAHDHRHPDGADHPRRRPRPRPSRPRVDVPLLRALPRAVLDRPNALHRNHRYGRQGRQDHHLQHRLHGPAESEGSSRFLRRQVLHRPVFHQRAGEGDLPAALHRHRQYEHERTAPAEDRRSHGNRVQRLHQAPV